MSRLAVFGWVALIWFGAAIFANNVAYIHMITGAALALVGHWSLNE